MLLRVVDLLQVRGEITAKVDAIWDTIWGRHLMVIEQLTYLLFIKRLDEVHMPTEGKSARTGQPVLKPTLRAIADGEPAPDVFP